MGIRDRGKRGGIRVIYYYVDSAGTIYLLMAYAKNEQADLTPSQKKALKQVIEGL